MDYGQFCPIAKAAEVLGEKWTILVLRELLYGTSRFSDFQRAIHGISPTMLNKRLKELEARGLIVKSGHDYRLTPAGEDLGPLVRQYALWGMRWGRGELHESELDVELLMWDIRRRVRPEFLPDAGCVIQFRISDVKDKADWWLLVDGVEDDKVSGKGERGAAREVTLKQSPWQPKSGTKQSKRKQPGNRPPPSEPDLLIQGTLRALTELWMGDITLHAALARRRLSLKGRPLLIRAIEQWLPLARYANIRPDPAVRPAQARPAETEPAHSVVRLRSGAG